MGYACEDLAEVRFVDLANVARVEATSKFCRKQPADVAGALASERLVLSLLTPGVPPQRVTRRFRAYGSLAVLELKAEVVLRRVRDRHTRISVRIVIVDVKIEVWAPRLCYRRVRVVVFDFEIEIWPPRFTFLNQSVSFTCSLKAHCTTLREHGIRR